MSAHYVSSSKRNSPKRWEIPKPASNRYRHRWCNSRHSCNTRKSRFKKMKTNIFPKRQNQGSNANNTAKHLPDFSCFISAFEGFCCCNCCGCGCRRSDGDFSSPRLGFSKSNCSVSFLGTNSSAGILWTFWSSKSISSPLRVLSPSFFSEFPLPN